MLLKVELSWDNFVYPDGSEVQGEVMHVDARWEGTAQWHTVAHSLPDMQSVVFEFDVPAGRALEVRTRAEVDGVVGEPSEVVKYAVPKPPVPVPTGLKLTLLSA